MSDWTDYQKEAERTMPEYPDVTNFVLGLCGESGEVAEQVKKYLYHGVTLDRTKLANELGDVLWYLAAIASISGLSLGYIAELNLAKLRERYPDGFREGGGNR